MKYRDLTRTLKKNGWYLKRQGGNHEFWTNGREMKSIPRHKEVKENLANSLIKYAQEYPGNIK